MSLDALMRERVAEWSRAKTGRRPSGSHGEALRDLLRSSLRIPWEMVSKNLPPLAGESQSIAAALRIHISAG
jgi:hypothetical protein